MIKNWSNTLIVAYSHLPKIVKSIDFRVENCVNSGFKSVHLFHGVTNEQLYGEILKLIDENEDIAGELQIRSIPTLILYVNGEVKEKMIGLTNKNELINTIKKY